MLRPHALSAVALALCICACDSRRDFAGSHELSGVLSLREGRWQGESEVTKESLVIVADAFDSDRLYLDFDCGLSATMRAVDSSGAGGALPSPEVRRASRGRGPALSWTRRTNCLIPGSFAPRRACRGGAGRSGPLPLMLREWPLR